jgi:hypothetical protein
MAGFAMAAIVAGTACTSTDASQMRADGRGVVATSASGQPVATDGRLAGAAQPMLVTCEPNQRALVRQTVVNGEAVAQVECVTQAGTAGYDPRVISMNPMPVTPARAYPAATTYPVAERPAVRERVVYRQAPERHATSGRSWQKSAVIIGSSAGVGAGVGAAVGGKKGALIGAAIGGGSAAIWDQATRR